MSAHKRVGSKELQAIREALSDRDLSVLASVAAFKLLSARQIERLHFRDHSSALSAARVCRRVLQRLTTDRLLVRLDRRIGGERAGSAAYIYAIGPVGHRLLQGDSRRRWREPSAAFVTHTLAVADVGTTLLTLNDPEVDVLELEPEPRCWRSFDTAAGVAETLRPDLAVATADSVSEWRWFIEVDLGTESGPAAIRKCSTYDLYYRTGAEQTNHDVFPKVLWVTPTTKRADLLARRIGEARGLHQELFAVTTTDQALGVLLGRTAP